LISGLLTIVIVLLIKEKNEKFTEYIHVHKQNEILFRSVTEKEYQAASPFTKKLIDKIDASINALNIIKKDSSVEYEAYLWISMDEKKESFNLFKNALLISPIESSQSDSIDKATSFEKPTMKFKICEPRASFAFIKAIEAYMVKNKEVGLTVSINTVGDCVEISYD
jgi:PDZ domain-containing secreted protein